MWVYVCGVFCPFWALVFLTHSTLYTLHSTLYTLHSTLYTLHSTLYTMCRRRTIRCCGISERR